MKRTKRILALFLAMAMVLGMSMTTFAAGETGTITVTGIGSEANLQVLKLIEPDTSKKTGWKFVDTEGVAAAFEEVFKDDVYKTNDQVDDQKIIWSLMNKEGTNTPVLNVPEWATNVPAATADQIQPALQTILKSEISFSDFQNGVASEAINSAGLYAIKANETGYAYNPMTAYIAPGDTFAATVPVAKRTKLFVDDPGKGGLTKEHNGTGDGAAIDEIVEYTIKTVVPYVPEGVTIGENNVVFKVVDEITGATYEQTGTNKVDVTVTIEGETGTVTPNAVTENADKSNDATDSFVVDLTNLLVANNANANKTVVIKYRAKVAEGYVENTATAEYGTLFDYVINDDDPETPDPEEPTDTDKLYTGFIKMVKTDESGNGLKGAQFRVYFWGKKDSNDLMEYASNYDNMSEEEKETYSKYYAVFENDSTTVKEWTTTEANAGTTAQTAETTGLVKITGLKHGVQYKFEEVTAPEGFSINTTDSTSTWEAFPENNLTKDNYTNEESGVRGSASMQDTQLAALPSTGGIGTTIFTVGGCAIMIIAAGLYFASRRRAAK